MSSINAFDLAKILPNLTPEEVIVDVREAAEYAEGHIKNSVNYPLSSIGKSLPALKQYKKIYLLCETGGRSSYAHEILKTTNIATTDITGGLFDLKRAGVELVEAL